MRGGTNNNMAMGCIPKKFNREPIIFLLQHAKRLPETEISHNIKGKIVAPICHILAQAPSLPFRSYNRRARAQALSEGTHILENVALHGLYSTVREGMRENTALARVLSLIDAVVSVVGLLVGGESGVEFALLDRGVEAVDAVESCGSVCGEVVGTVADEGAYGC